MGKIGEESCASILLEGISAVFLTYPLTCTDSIFIRFPIYYATGPPFIIDCPLSLSALVTSLYSIRLTIYFTLLALKTL